jgi:hypothetical protein
MRKTWGSIAALLVLGAALAGCEPTLRQKIRPPKQEQVYTLPDEKDPRWDKPLEYPKGTLNQDTIKQARDAKEKAPPPGSMGGPGMGGRMGGY